MGKIYRSKRSTLSSKQKVLDPKKEIKTLEWLLDNVVLAEDYEMAAVIFKRLIVLQSRPMLFTVL